MVSLAFLLLAGCGAGRRRAAAAEEQQTPQQGTEQPVTSAKQFPYIDVPMYIEAPEQRLEYIVEHYWDKFDFSDSTYVESEALERAYGEYAGILSNYPDMGEARRAIGRVMTGAEKYPAMYDRLWDLADKYFYNANSPVRNDEVYIGVLESVIANPAVDDLLKIAPKEKLAIASMNRPGTKANNFTYATSNGKRGTLHGIDAAYTLIFFYNLGCPSCKAMREDLIRMLQETGLAEYVGTESLRIIAMYPDSQLEEWEKYLNDLPSDWINGYDPTADHAINRLYDMKAIPSLYLLDKDKKVMLKDFTDPMQLYYAIGADS